MPSPYSSPAYWPKDADKAHYLAAARRSCPAAADHLIEQLAKTMAYTDATEPLSRFNRGLVKVSERAAVMDGEPVSEVEAEKLRALQPQRKTLGVRWAA